MDAINWTQAIGQLTLLLGNGFVIGWVWKVNTRQYENLKSEFTRYKTDTGKRIDKLEEDLLTSNKKATSWFKKFYSLCLIVERGHCKDKDCGVYNKYIDFQQKEGELK